MKTYSQVYCTCYDDNIDDYFSSPDDEVFYHEIEAPWDPSEQRWVDVGIAAWAAEIPPGAPIDPPPPSEIHTQKPLLPLGAHRAPPKLLKSSHRIVPPSLCKTALPLNTSASSPIATPPRDSISRTSQDASLGKTSSNSGPTESVVSTPTSSQPVPILPPSRRPSLFRGVYTNVRSWVSPPFALAELPHQQHPPVSRVDSSKLLTQLQHPLHLKRSFGFQTSSARGRHPSELVCHDEHLSFKARGRNTSRAAAWKRHSWLPCHSRVLHYLAPLIDLFCFVSIFSCMTWINGNFPNTYEATSATLFCSSSSNSSLC